ncbi:MULTISPECIES: hypothetical protein [unclassified Mesorhizobium]|uniref:hypothetical protein n=1 Tax=unclassified Mesorhizobium TaxID=325217 RepID=UPI0033394936
MTKIFDILVGSMAIGAVLAKLCMPANAAVGDDGTTAPIGTSGATVGTESPDNPTNTDLTRIVDAMSSAEITRFKKRCIDVIESRGAYDRDLRQLCLLIWRH